MKLDRNIPGNNGRGKYALIKLRETGLHAGSIVRAKSEHKMVVIEPEAIDFGGTEDTEFFVIRLKDKYAALALRTYAIQAGKDDPEYAREILKLADRAENHPNKRRPD